ncbi:MAG: hydroxymethylbilane synthase [Anaerolineales bacterium]
MNKNKVRENGEVRFATRESKLAQYQTSLVADALKEYWPGLSIQVKHLRTRGDELIGQPLPEIGGKGLFTAELDLALRQGEADLAVHSLKDLPIDEAPDLVIAAIPLRQSARDVLLSRKGNLLSELPEGATVGTSSLRRQAQVLSYRADLKVKPIRGNVDTRIKKLLDGQFDAIVLAEAGVVRLGLEEFVSERLSFDIMVPAPGQGALAVVCRRDLPTFRDYLAVIDHPDSRRAVTAERAFLAALGGGCSLPVGAYAEIVGKGKIKMLGRVISKYGEQQINVAGEGEDLVSLGRTLAKQALAMGAGELLDV